MKKIKNILFTIILFLINITIVNAKDDVINRIDVSINLDKFGNAHIEEIWDVKANMGTEFYKAEYNLGKMQISNFKVYENDRLFTFINNWNVNGSLESKAYKNGFNYTTDGLELCWGKGSMGNHTYKITYDVSNFVFKTEDADVIYWQIINMGMSNVPKKFTLTLNSFYSFPDTLDVWGYGYKGYAYVNNGNIYMSNEENTKLKKGDYAVLLVKFPLNTFTINNSNRYSQFYTFNDVLTKAEENTYSYDYSQKFDIIKKILPYITVLIPIVMYLGLFLLAMYIKSLGNKLKKSIIKKYKFEKLGGKIKENEIHYFRDIPCQKNIFKAYFLSQVYKLNKKETDILGSILLKWLFEDKIEIKNSNETGNLNKNNQIVILKPNLVIENDIENEMYDMLFYASKDGVLENKELEKWSKKNYTKIHNWFEKCEAYGRSFYEVDGLTYKVNSKYLIKDELKSEAINLAGLKKYLTVFSRIDKKLPIEVKLWKEYLIFAQIFGIADMVADKFKNLYPQEIKSLSDDFVMLDFDTIRLLNSISRSAVSSANYGKALVDAKNSARDMARNYSSGGGGFSSGGGGGGSFGGGGGGGR